MAWECVEHGSTVRPACVTCTAAGVMNDNPDGVTWKTGTPATTVGEAVTRLAHDRDCGAIPRTGDQVSADDFPTDR
jgi:hypothetical protein